ncbi:MAG: RNA polymerase sigma factor [Caldilineaceae bacterium]|nr:RNA polymerase sigma factor [Caldilineaceae bacterium]
MSDTKYKFEELIRPHLDFLYRLAYRFTLDKHAAEDILQDLLIKLYRRRVQLDEIAILRPWLARALYHQFIDDRRRIARDRLTMTSIDDDTLAAIEPSMDSRMEPPAVLALAKDTDRLHGALKLLSQDHRVVVTLHDLLEMSLEEVQQVLDLPLGTIKSRLHRGRQRLANLLISETS